MAEASPKGRWKTLEDKMINRTESFWEISAKGTALRLDRRTGSLVHLTVTGDNEFTWTEHPGNLTVRDDRLQRTFGREDICHIEFTQEGDALRMEKVFKGAPWTLSERYAVEGDTIRWDAELSMADGELRSCEIRYHIPWPQPLYPMEWWTAKEGMPSAPHRFSSISFEYGEITSGTSMPSLYCFRRDVGAGLLLSVPFDFKVPRFRFIAGYRDPDLEVSFDWLALRPGKPARAKLIFRGGGGDWRPALGWLYENNMEYFEPQVGGIESLWGGHACTGRCLLTGEDARKMAELDLRWYEVHAHFPAYGNYHPEGKGEWLSGHNRQEMISVAKIRETIRTLHQVSAKAFLYLQLTGDGDNETVAKDYASDRIRNIYGDLCSAWKRTTLMNSDISLPFGRDIARQIRGIVDRYPEMDGIFLDQACYNFLDTAHDDGITARNNSPGYMTGWNYEIHLKELCKLLVPSGKRIFGNAPFGITQMRYLDGLMAESSSWLCDHLQYHTIGSKPMFFLEYQTDREHIEPMLQNALLHGCGFTSLGAAIDSKDLYDAYLPLIHRLAGRRWVFEPDPITLPFDYKGNVFRGMDGSVYVSFVKSHCGIRRSTPLKDRTFGVRIKQADDAKRVLLQTPGKNSKSLPYRVINHELLFDVPADAVCGLVRIQ